MRSARQSRGPLALALALACVHAPPAPGGCTLAAQWQWDGLASDPTHPTPTSIPLVGQLTDDDGDTVVGPGDVPDVVFVHHSLGSRGVITALDGADGSIHFTTTTPEVGSSGLVLADLDGDAVVEIVAFGSDFDSIVAYRNDGTLRWQTPGILGVVTGQTMGVADVDQDGRPEIYFDAYMRASDATPRWQGTAGVGRHAVDGRSTSLAIDLVPASPGLELVAGNTCYARDGSILWSRSDLPDGFASVGDLDGDDSAEVVLVTGRTSPRSIEVHVLDRAGASLGAPLVVASTLSAAPATIADLDGDGRPEVIVPMGASLEAYAWAGSALQPRWSSPVRDETCCAGASAFDADGDGTLEVFYAGSEAFHVIDGATGAILDSRPGPSSTLLELPVVADIDADGLPEIVVASGTVGFPGHGYVTAYECGTPVPVRCLWNEQGYHVTNVSDDGTVPRVELAPWLADVGFLEQEQRICCGAAVPPLPDVVVCLGGAADLDAGFLSGGGCTGGGTWEWRDDTGPVVGTTASITASPDVSTTYEVDFDCPGQPSCSASTTARVIVHLPPLFDASSLAGADPDRCNLGIELTWSPATYRDPSGSGVYDVHRSETSCADALAQPPIAVVTAATRWVDTSTRAGVAYYYAVQAEDARTATPCPAGPDHGGAVDGGLACAGPIVEAPDAYTPDLLGHGLRASHAGDAVTLAWPGGRLLLADEHYHVLKAYGATGFVMVNPEAQRATTWTETDASSRLQFFDVRIANACEIVSLDDE